MSLAALSIRRPVFAWMFMASLILFGLICFKFLGVSELPDVDFPMVNISATLNGASPEAMESDVVDALENAVMGVQGLRDITSTARYGGANISLEFDLDRNIDLAMQEVQSKVSQAQKSLPKDIDPPIISKINPEDQPIMWLSLSGKISERELMVFARDKIINQLQLVPGVGDVFFGGYLEPNIRVWLDRQKMARYELSIDDIVNAVTQEHVELPAGNLQKNDKEYTLRVVGEALSPQEFGQIAINKRGGQPNFNRIQIKDVARVEAGLEDVRRTSRVMGEPAIGIGVRKQRGTNAVDIARGVKAKLAEMNKTMPEGMKLGVNFDSTRFIEASIHELEFELIISALLTGIVCWIFLGSLSSTFNILLAIPTSLIGAFTAIYFFGFTLNTFTFLGLILAVGIVVDDAIMVLENIVRYREMGYKKKQAALEGTNQIAFAATATTLAIVAIFLPVAFMKGVIGKFFFQFAITITVTVGISLLEALTLTPMRCADFLYVPAHGAKKRRMEVWLDQLTQWYQKKLVWCLDHRWKVVSGALGIFIASFFLLPGMKKEFVPAQDQSIFMVRVQTPVGSSLDYTNKKMQDIEAIALKTPEIQRYFSAIGGFGGMSQVNTGMMFITLKQKNERKKSQQDMMDQVRKEFNSVKDVKVVIQDLSARGFSAQRGFPIEFSIRGSDWNTLVEQSKKIMDKLKEDKRFVDVDSNYDEGMPEIKITPDRNKTAARGVSVQDIGRAVNLLLGGDRIARFNDNGKRIDVRVKLEDQYRTDPDDVLKIYVRNNRGELIKLQDVAHIDITKSLVSITRQQRERAISIYSNVAPKASQADLVTKIEGLQKELPQGYHIVMGGSSKAFGESFKSLMFALYLGIIVAYMILASQFNSFIHPVTVLLALPFSLTGAWLALRLGGQSLNIYSMIGLLLLMGIVKKNSIMLVDFTNQMREGEKLGVREALIKACPVRLRPILMTSIAIVAAALPSVVGFGAGSETRIPMSLSVVGGVILSTFFTLFVVPCAYSLFSRWERNKKGAEA